MEKREEKVGVEPDNDEKNIEDVVLDDERERHGRMVFEGNNGGSDGAKDLIHAKKWYSYNSEHRE